MRDFPMSVCNYAFYVDSNCSTNPKTFKLMESFQNVTHINHGVLIFGFMEESRWLQPLTKYSDAFFNHK